MTPSPAPLIPSQPPGAAPQTVGTKPSGDLLSALEKAVSVATFPWPLSMATPRDKWEALLSLFMGQQPVLGRCRAGDLPYLRVSEDARELPDLLRKTVFDVKVDSVGRLTTKRRRREPDPRASQGQSDPGTPVHADALLSRLGLEVFAASRNVRKGPARDRLYEDVLYGLVEFFDLRVDSAVARRLHRLLGIPEQRSRKIREEVKDLRKELATSESASRAASFLTRTFLALSDHGGEYDAQGWLEVHVRAERVQSYLARFRPMSLRRGASAMVGDVIACVREQLVEETSVACLVQDLGGTLVLLLPHDPESDGPASAKETHTPTASSLLPHGPGGDGPASAKETHASTASSLLPHGPGGDGPASAKETHASTASSLLRHDRESNGHASAYGWADQALARRVRSILAESLRKPVGFFRAQYPLGSDVAEAASLESRGVGLEAWASRGLFPDLSLRVREVTLGEWARGEGTPDSREVPVRGDADLFATPPRSLEPRCFGCHFEQGTAALPWWPDREKLCPACTLVATAGRRLSEHALEGASELVEGFRSYVLGVSQRQAFGNQAHACTIYLDGSGVGKWMAVEDPWERRARSRGLEAEVRRRYGSGIRQVAAEWFKNAPSKVEDCKFPLEIIFIGGDDVCVAVHHCVAAPFLRGFLEEPGSEVRWAGVVLAHETSHFELVRLHEARSRLMKKAKELARAHEAEAVTLVLATLAPLSQRVELQEDTRCFERVDIAHSVEEAMDAWPRWEVNG